MSDRPAETPLESWKAIAAHLNRDARTVRRWEAFEGLPVHRHHHFARSSVYAYPSELDAWRATRRPDREVSSTGWLGPRTRALAVAALLVLALVSSGGGRVMSSVGSAAQEQGMTVRQVWTGPEVADVVLFGGPSPDGRYLSYVDWETGDLAIRDLATGEKRRITNKGTWQQSEEFAFSSKISPDGQQVAYVWSDKESPYHLRLTSINDSRDGVKPRVLHSNQDSPDRDIFVLAVDGSRETPLVEHPGNDFVLGWVPDGRRILLASDRSGALSAWVIAVADGRPQGAPELVEPDIGRVVPMGFTRTGAFYFGLHTATQDVYIATLDPVTGRPVSPPTPVNPRLVGRGSAPAWSPDGQYLAYLSRRSTASDNDVRGPRVICIRSLKTGEERELSTPLSFEIWYRLHWSPDGRFLLATGSDNKGRGGLYRIDVQSGEIAPISLSSENFGALTQNRGPTGELWRISAEGGEPQKVGLATQNRGGTLAIHPDGRQIAFTAGEQKEEVWVMENFLPGPKAAR